MRPDQGKRLEDETMLPLEGKTAFVSGGSRGIGFACAKRLAADGARLFLVALSHAGLEEAAKKITAETGREALFLATDLRKLPSCVSAATSGANQLGRVNILINAAGATKGGVFPQQPDDEMIDGFALKFHGAVRLTRVLWPALKRSQGTVINIVGGFARTPSADFMVGGAVNAALANFSKALANKGLEDDVNVNWIHPGMTATERLKGIFANEARWTGRNPEDLEAEAIAREKVRRLGQPEDVASLVAFLCSPEARHIHGTGIACDGGGSRGYY